MEETYYRRNRTKKLSYQKKYDDEHKGNKKIYDRERYLKNRKLKVKITFIDYIKELLDNE